MFNSVYMAKRKSMPPTSQFRKGIHTLLFGKLLKDAAQRRNWTFYEAIRNGSFFQETYLRGKLKAMPIREEEE